MKRACKDCEFSGESYTNLWRKCRRRPPTFGPDYNEGDEGDWIWPLVEENDWCGEFQSRDAGPKLARPDPLDSVRVRQLSRCFAELSQVDADAKQDAWMVMRTKQVLGNVAEIIDLPAAVEELKKEMGR
jgi:hypothetical protein